MNSHFKFLAAALLFSTLPLLANSDYDHCRPDARAINKVAATLDDVEAAVLYLLVDKIPAKFSCSFDVKGRTKKAIVKHFVNRFLLNNAFDVVADVPNAGTVTVLNTDQAMEIGAVALDDILDKKSAGTILTNAGKTFVREKIVAALVWLLAQTPVESLLPDSLTTSTLYTEGRNEVARHFVDKGLERVL